jgi:2-polyprenyl-3-methyl-5-hydroxy-6-metoxy-1,4-benzoquinol methylase
MHRCAGCQCLYLDPRPTQASIGIAYSKYFTHEAAESDSLLSPRTLLRRLRNDYLAARFGYELPNREPFGQLVVSLLPTRKRRVERMVRELEAPRAPARLLDIGCGNGEFLMRMRDVGWLVTGHDVDPKAAAVVREAGIECVDGPLRAEAFQSKFDAITLHHVIEHLHDPLGTLSICRELLAPGGRLWIATHNAASLGHRRYGRHWIGLDCPRHLVLFSRQAMEGALARAGFTQSTVRLDIGMYGASAAAADLHLRVTKGKRLGHLAMRAENLLGDTVGLLMPGLRDDLVAIARV